MSAIATERLSLLPWEAEHVELLCRLGSTPEVMAFIGSGELWSEERSKEVSDIAVAHWAQHGFGWRVAAERATGRLIGFIGLNLAGEGTRGVPADEFEIGWWMDPVVWGRGFAREGGAAARDEAFNHLNAPSVIARIQPANKASIAVAESIGLTHSFDTTGKYGEPVSVYRLDPATANAAD